MKDYIFHIIKKEKKIFKDFSSNPNQNKNGLDQINVQLKNKVQLEPQPPQSFISIVNENKNDNNNIKYINNIILKNIDLISNYKYIYNNPNLFLFDEKIGKITYSNFVNINFINYLQLYNSFNLLKEGLTPKTNKIPFPSFSIFNYKYRNQEIFLKRRRKKPDANRRIHSALDDDNILRKIQVHFLSFITSFTNDVISTFCNDKNKLHFKNLDYQIKKIVNHSFVEQLKSKTIGEILQLRVSPKMKIKDKYVNKKISNHKYIDELKNKKICEILQLRVSPKMKIHGDFVNKIVYSKIRTMFPSLTNFFNKTCLSLFREYYLNKNNLFEVNGIIIPLSKKTKTFSDLITKNYKFRDKLKKVAIKNY